MYITMYMIYKNIKRFLFRFLEFCLGDDGLEKKGEPQKAEKSEKSPGLRIAVLDTILLRPTETYALLWVYSRDVGSLLI